VKSDFRRKVIVKENEGPGGSFPSLEWAKAICGKTKRNIPRIGEVFM
jgi:hypothetical protein